MSGILQRSDSSTRSNVSRHLAVHATQGYSTASEYIGIQPGRVLAPFPATVPAPTSTGDQSTERRTHCQGHRDASAPVTETSKAGPTRVKRLGISKARKERVDCFAQRPRGKLNAGPSAWKACDPGGIKSGKPPGHASAPETSTYLPGRGWSRESIRASPRERKTKTLTMRITSLVEQEINGGEVFRQGKKQVRIHGNDSAGCSSLARDYGFSEVGDGVILDWTGDSQARGEQICQLRRQLLILGEKSLEEVLSLKLWDNIVDTMHERLLRKWINPIYPYGACLCGTSPVKWSNGIIRNFFYRRFRFLFKKVPTTKEAKRCIGEAIDALMVENNSAETKQALQKWNRYATNQPGYIHRQEEEEEKWEKESAASNAEALRLMKTFVPPDIFHAGVGKLRYHGLPAAVAKRVFVRKVRIVSKGQLQIVFVDGPTTSKSGPVPFLVHYFVNEWRTVYTTGMHFFTHAKHVEDDVAWWE